MRRAYPRIHKEARQSLALQRPMTDTGSSSVNTALSAARPVTAHAMPRGTPAVRWQFPHFDVTDDDLALTARVLDAYRKAVSAEQQLFPHLRPQSGIWEVIRQSSHQALISEVEQQEPDLHGLAAILVNAMR